MSSPVESVARSQSATIQSVESEDKGRSIELSDEVRDTIDVPVEGESFEPVVDGRKRKSKTSEVWQYFVEVEVKEKGKMVKKLECIHCRKKYLAVIGGPTTTLRRHIQQCACIKRAKGKKKGLINFESCESVNTTGFNYSSGSYDQMKCREILAKMIIAHELSFSFVEYQWFNILMKYNNPLYQKVSRATIKKDCIKVFETEKEKIRKNFKNVDMISLTSDCWTSNQTIGYICLTAHFIDFDWKLQK